MKDMYLLCNKFNIAWTFPLFLMAPILIADGVTLVPALVNLYLELFILAVAPLIVMHLHIATTKREVREKQMSWLYFSMSLMLYASMALLSFSLAYQANIVSKGVLS